MKLLKITTIAIISLKLINCSGGGGGGSTNYNSGPDSSGGTFLDTGTSVTYNSTTASNHQAYDAYENVEGSAQSSYTNPFDQINAYKAYGYGYSGEGKQIAVMDSNFDTDHYTYQDKTVSTYGTLTADSTSSYHGNFVSSVAAGYLDTSYSGSVAMHGVAYNADLHLSDYDQKGSETYYPEQWANSLDDASEAVVQNNSWGVNEEYSSSTTYTSTSLGTMWNNAGLTANSTSVDSYVTALNNFQDHGVIVYAISNTDSFGDVDVQAALPEIYSQLAEAWITAVNVDITGSTYTRKSAPCGSTAKYCLGGDGWKINGAAYYTDNSYFVTAGAQGTSFVAPQISGAIAILAEAFPTQSPEQWADRLLASADNSFFTASGNVGFSNGITHAYNTEFGHGIMDIYAALRPITSSRMYESILIGENIENASINSLNKSSVIANPAFGDSINSALKNKKGIFYDALYGAFEYDYDNSFITSSTIKNNYLEKHFDNSKYDKINKSPYAKQNIIASFHNLNSDDEKINYDN